MLVLYIMQECYIAIIIAYADLVENGGVSPHLSREWSATVQLSIGVKGEVGM